MALITPVIGASSVLGWRNWTKLLEWCEEWQLSHCPALWGNTPDADYMQGLFFLPPLFPVDPQSGSALPAHRQGSGRGGISSLKLRPAAGPAAGFDPGPFVGLSISHSFTNGQIGGSALPAHRQGSGRGGISSLKLRPAAGPAAGFDPGPFVGLSISHSFTNGQIDIFLSQTTPIYYWLNL
ncbi:hypothetical protein B0H10DRAFT_1963173 [Mycena sp. CBHHK59/15]|nr:hypothetical protein B0H10DRAFT_1963173 [Mycena sp. CBHHK59/15]